MPATHRDQRPPLPHGNPRRGELGTTLIELMMGIVVLIVITGVAMPMTSSLLRQQHLRNAAEELVFAAETARSKARSNRIAYGVFVGNGGLVNDEFKGDVVRGLDTSCSTVDLVNGTKVHSFDFSKNNVIGEPEVKVNQKAPGDFAQPSTFICFKPDGRVLNGATGLPFSAPAGTKFSAGDVFFELVRISDTGSKIGNKLQVQITYSGNAKITFGYDLDKLK